MSPRIRDYPGGYFVPVGWQPLVLPMLDSLERLRADIFCVTEKYGALKVHVIDPTPEQVACYRPVMLATNWLCEDCGAAGTLRVSRYGHIKCCCDDHPPEMFHHKHDRKPW